MGKLKPKDFYPDFHVNIRKDGRVNGIKPVTLKDMGLPFDLDYPEQTIAELSKEQYENLVEEFIFLIDELLPRDIQDLFYKATLDPRQAYWKLFEEAARRMHLPYYLNCHRDEAHGNYPNISDGIRQFLYEGRTLADIYLNTCITKEMVIDELDYIYTVEQFSDECRDSKLFPVEVALFELSKYNYKKNVTLPGCDSIADLVFYDKDQKPELVTVEAEEEPDYDDFWDNVLLSDEDILKNTDYMDQKEEEENALLKAQYEKRVEEIKQIEECCAERGISFLKLNRYQAFGLYESGDLRDIIRNSIGNPEYAKEFNQHGIEGEDIMEPGSVEEKTFSEGYLFEGKLRKIKLYSDAICYGPCPMPDDETEQSLTINSNGGVWITRKSFGDGVIEKTNFKIDTEEAKRLLSVFEKRFSQDHQIWFVTDIGSWEMILTNEEGKEFHYSGPLCEEEHSVVEGLSDMVRETVGRDDLFVFDGNPDKITELKLEYTRESKIKPKVLPEGAAYEYITWNYSETLTIDRATETLTNHVQFANAASVTNTYHIDGGICNLLDELWPEMFDDIQGNPEDVVNDPLEQRKYKLTVHTKQGDEKVIEGSYDKLALPDGWPEFIDKIYDFISFYGIGEIFNEEYYDKPKRRKIDYIFCDVQFEAGGKTYCYLADDDSYEVNDTVLVPTGQDNHEAIVQIVAKNYYSAENAPFPVEKAKHIIKRIDEVEIADYLHDE